MTFLNRVEKFDDEFVLGYVFARNDILQHLGLNYDSHRPQDLPKILKAQHGYFDTMQSQVT